MYKLFVTDLDGTLLNDNKEISARCREDIIKLKKKGIKVVLATGRPYHGIVPYIKALDLYDDENYVIVYNGAVVISARGNEILFDVPLSLDSYKELYELSKQLGVYIHAITFGSVLTPMMNPYTGVEVSINNSPVIEGAVCDVDPSTKVIKVMFVDDPKKLDNIISQIPDWAREKYTIVRSADIFLEFLNKSVDKSVGVSIIAEKLGIPMHEVIAVGDAGNDVRMIKNVGLGVAMTNASEDVKEVADYITLTNEEDGVAQVIERFML